jgi:hypothetical protein
MAVLGPREKGTAHKRYRPSDIQAIQCRKDDVSRVIMSLKSNIAVITALRKFYARLSENKDFPFKDESLTQIESFLTSLDEILGEFTIHTARAELLEGIIRDRKELVSFSISHKAPNH